MSSLLDTALRSDAAPTPGTPASDDGHSRRPPRSSSIRPRGPPSESAGAPSDAGGFPDDEMVSSAANGRKIGQIRDVPKVVDVTGETLSLRFQEFLERLDYKTLLSKQIADRW